MVGENDANARTFRGDAMAAPQEETPSTPSESDLGSAFAASEPPPVVANLDERLAASDAGIAAPIDLDAGDDLLDLGPTSQSADDLDFAFDVSEQLPASDSEEFHAQPGSLTDVSDSQIVGDPSAQSDPLAGDYDVSSSDLAADSGIDLESPGEPPSPAGFAETPPPPPPAAPEDDGLISISEETGMNLVAEHPVDPNPAEEDSFSGSSAADLLLDSSDAPLAAAASVGSVAVAPPQDAFETSMPEEMASTIDASVPSMEPEGLIVGDRVVPAELRSPESSAPDLSPMVQQQIQETLEKVAWEAFSDLSESVVKQVMERVEQIAWDVIPQMAETLVREEIRRMKGEDD